MLTTKCDQTGKSDRHVLVFKVVLLLHILLKGLWGSWGSTDKVYVYPWFLQDRGGDDIAGHGKTGGEETLVPIPGQPGAQPHPDGQERAGGKGRDKGLLSAQIMSFLRPSCMRRLWKRKKTMTMKTISLPHRFRLVKMTLQKGEKMSEPDALPRCTGWVGSLRNCSSFPGRWGTDRRSYKKQDFFQPCHDHQ